MARDLLLECESGEVTEFVAICYRRDGYYRFYGGGVESRHKMAGALLDAALNRLGYRWRDEEDE